MSDRIKPSPPDFSTWNFVDSSLLHVKLKGGDTVVYKSAEKDNRTWFVVVNSYAHPLQPARGVEFNFFDRGVVMKGWGLGDGAYCCGVRASAQIFCITRIVWNWQRWRLKFMTTKTNLNSR